jgi:sulfoquinovosyltransferase
MVTVGFVALESMASGVPVVGCNAGGVPSLIANNTDGLLHEVGRADVSHKDLAP